MSVSTASVYSACATSLAFLCVAPAALTARAADPLPSWEDTPTKQAIIQFVERVTEEGGRDFVPPSQRIATFDNDGTLWSEQPYYFQLAFAFDRVKAMAPEHPEWKTEQPFKGVLDGDLKSVMAGGKKALLELLATTHAGMTNEEFEQIVNDWFLRHVTQRRDDCTKRWFISRCWNC